MDVDDRKQVAEEAGYVLLSQDDGQEIYGRDDLPTTYPAPWNSTAPNGPCTYGTSTSIPSAISTLATPD